MLQVTDIVALITALGLGTAIPKLIDWYIAYKKRKEALEYKKSEEDNAFTAIFDAIHEVYYTLLTILRDTKAHRVVVLKTTNGGGRPTLTGRLYSSVIYEAFENPLTSVKENWQKQELDPAYMELLFNMNKTGRISVITETMQKGILRDLYLAEGIKKSWIYKIYERENEYIYISLNFTEVELEEPALANIFRMGVGRLRKLFSEHNKI